MDKKKIAENLRKARGSIQRKSVCEACGISLAALSMYETGERIPRDEIKKALSDFYGISIEELFYA